ncbi:hypothetical protein GCM10023260_08810 [Bartonella acomydis]|uniref:Uncharacterized protein n=1 Tax=Bartonella acomydis TaxID=686234 RepID=A0ABP9MLC0_9HYPH
MPHPVNIKHIPKMLAGNIFTSHLFIAHPIFLSIWLIDLPVFIGDLFHTQTHPHGKQQTSSLS